MLLHVFINACNYLIILFAASLQGFDNKSFGSFTSTVIRDLDDGAIGYKRMCE